MTLGEVARELGVSVETVRTIEARALWKLGRSVLREFVEVHGERRRRNEIAEREPDVIDDELEGEQSAPCEAEESDDRHEFEPGAWSKRAEGPVLGADEARALLRAWRLYQRFESCVQMPEEPDR